MKRLPHLLILVLFSLPAGESHAQQSAALPTSAVQHRQQIAQFAEWPADVPVKCGFPLITRMLEQRASLSPPAASALQHVMTRPGTQTSKMSGGFRVHYDTTGTHAAALLDASYNRIPNSAHAYADSVLATIQRVVAVEIDSLGYLLPPPDGDAGGGPEYDIYVQELGNYYGETAWDSLNPVTRTGSTYMTIDNDFAKFVKPPSNQGMPALRVTLAHEFHHAIQVGRYGWWQGDDYFYEITSTWMEDVVFTEVNDYYNYVSLSWPYSHFRFPDKEFVSGADLVMYSRGIWGQYVAKKFSAATMRRAWENIPAVRPDAAMDQALRERSSSLAVAFSEWAVWNYFTNSRSDSVLYYPEGANFPRIRAEVIDFFPPDRTLTGTLPPLATRYHQVNTNTDTLMIIVSNTNAIAAESGNASVPYSVSVSNQQIDDSYLPAGAGLYAKLTVADPVHWTMWFVVGKNVNQGSQLPEGTPFPNPFVSDGKREVFIPLSSAAQVKCTLAIYNASMDLVYSRDVMSEARPILGRQAVSWNGLTTAGALAATGVYVYVLRLADDRLLTGKIALVKQ